MLSNSAVCILLGTKHDNTKLQKKILHSTLDYNYIKSCFIPLISSHSLFCHHSQRVTKVPFLNAHMIQLFYSSLAWWVGQMAAIGWTAVQ